MKCCGADQLLPPSVEVKTVGIEIQVAAEVVDLARLGGELVRVRVGHARAAVRDGLLGAQSEGETGLVVRERR